MIVYALGVTVLIGWFAMVAVLADVLCNKKQSMESRASAFIGGMCILSYELGVANDALGLGL